MKVLLNISGATFDELLTQMSEIVKEKMEGYKTDFFVHDTRELYDAFQKNRDEWEFIWLVRKNGTYLVKSGDTEKYDNVKTQCRVIGEYYLTANSDHTRFAMFEREVDENA